MTAPREGGVGDRGDDRAMTNATVSRILLFTDADDMQPTVAAIAAAADAEPEWGEVTRSDGTTAPRARIDIDGTRIEVTEGRDAAPAVVELQVADEKAAAAAAAKASGYTAKAAMVGMLLRTPAMSLVLRSA